MNQYPAAIGWARYGPQALVSLTEDNFSFFGLGLSTATSNAFALIKRDDLR